MGIDEAILHSVAEGKSPPTLRLYRWAPSCVSIGYFQSMAAEVDLGACRAAGIDALRRMTGGGAVFHQREITYSIVLPETSPLAGADILDSYRLLCGALVRGLAFLGVDAAFAPINDIVTGGKKISGNAQTRKRGCLLQHGTLLLGLDLEIMFSLLLVPKEKLAGKLIKDAKERVTSLEAALNRGVSYEEAASALTRGFSETFAAHGLGLEASRLDDSELALARELASKKYSSPEWNGQR